MFDLSSLGKTVVLVGLGLLLLGALLWALGRAGIQLGRLPGDLRFEAGGVSCFLPLASSVLVSLLLTLVLNLIARLRR